MKLTNLHKLAIIVLCLIMAGPEFGVALELIMLIDAFGIELILIFLSASFWNYWGYIKAKLEELDPYFFISSSKDVLRCPALLAHAIPGSMSLFFYVLAVTAVSA